MTPLKILIVEDNLLNATTLKEELFSIGHKVIGVAKNAIEALKIFKQKKPNFAILDVQLKDSELNGIDIAKSFNEIKRIPIIFITGVQDLDLKNAAIQTSPANYLEKPWHPNQLKGAIGFAQHNFKKSKHSNPTSELSQKDCYKLGEYFFVKNNDRFERIAINDIIVIKAANSCVEIITAQNRIVFYTNLGNFFQQINHPNLLRIHRSYAVNIQNVYAFNTGTAYIKKGHFKEEIPIGKSYRDDFNNLFFRLKSD